MRVRLQHKPKPDNYTESCMINVADGWREGNVWYPGRSVRHALKRVTIAESGAKRTEVSRGHSVRLASRHLNCDKFTTTSVWKSGGCEGIRVQCTQQEGFSAMDIHVG